MDLNNEFEVAVPIAKAWEVLTNLERIAPCMPGAQLQEVEGEEHRGVVKVKVGPITASYKGKAVFIEKDDENYRATLKADGRDTRGQGNANATITAQLVTTEAGTKVNVDTDLAVTGKVAQLGRGVMADVSAKLLDQFVENLEAMLETDSSAELEPEDMELKPDEEHPVEPENELVTEADVEPEAEVDEAEDVGSNANSQATPKPETDTDSPAETPNGLGGVRQVNQPEPEPVDLLETAGAPLAKRVVPAVVGVIVILLIWRWLRGRDK